jgi:hypothetical protein
MQVATFGATWSKVVGVSPVPAALVLCAALLGTTACDWFIYTLVVEEVVENQSIDGDPSGGMLGDEVGYVELTFWQNPDLGSDRGIVQHAIVSGITFEIAPLSTDPALDPLEDGEPDGFAFVESVDIYIEAVVDGTPRRELVAFISEGDPQLVLGAASVALMVTGVDLLEFVDAEGGFDITIEAAGVLPPDRVIFNAHITYEVTVDAY